MLVALPFPSGSCSTWSRSVVRTCKLHQPEAIYKALSRHTYIHFFSAGEAIGDLLCADSVKIVTAYARLEVLLNVVSRGYRKSIPTMVIHGRICD